MTKKQPLTVYKASAGSGKTFRLAVEYIKLLVEDPNSYRSILAVTFTNKATEEMKMRILSQLYGIAHGLPESNSYFGEVKKGLEKNSGTPWADQSIRERAKTALKNLLSNYDQFRVMTIDSFFQTVLRNLARELQLTANLRVSLSQDESEDLAVDRMIESLKKDDQVFQAIIAYIEENIDEAKSWNVIRSIKSFGKQIFRDDYQKYSHKLQQLSKEKVGGLTYFRWLNKELRKIEIEASEKIVRYGERFYQLMDDHGLTEDDLKGKSRGIVTYFNKLKEGEYDDEVKGKGTKVEDCINSADAWVGNSPRKEDVRQLAENELMRLLEEAETTRQKIQRRANTASLTRKHLYQLSLLSRIDEEVKELNKETNSFFLSDTQHLLREVIGDDDAPFVYEKIGSHLRHIMIDEFQDTSRVQWNNFMVLMIDCMSQQESHDLIVGDVKQSIYRWRSGDWRLLNNIQGEFGEKGTHLPQMIHEEPLKTNRRSSRRVVAFNNAFFIEAAQAEQSALEEKGVVTGLDQMKTAYADVEQEIPDGKPMEGYVRLSLFGEPKQEQGQSKGKSKGKEKKMDKNTFRNHALEAMMKHINHLVESGIPYSSIAIIIRVNSDIPVIAKYFLEHSDIPVVSDLAFRLDASLSVNAIIMALRYLVNPGDDLNRAALSNLWQRRVNKDSSSTTELFVKEGEKRLALPRELLEQRMDLLSMPLYELVERLFTLFDLEKLEGQDPYLCTFLDLLRNFLTDEVADIDALLNAWDEELRSKTVQAEAVDGVRIVSIHSSKGLEYGHVIIPFCDWVMEHNDTQIWCQPPTNTSPYEKLPFASITYGKKAANSDYAADYQEECLQNTMDNLNLLYVAFTRAKDSLVVFGHADQSNSRSQVLQAIIGQLKEHDTLKDALLLKAGDEGFEDKAYEGENILLEYGELNVTKRQEVELEYEKDTNVFLQKEEELPLRLRSYPLASGFTQSNESVRFTKGDEDDDEQAKKHYMKLGLILHDIFARIHTFADVPSVLRELEMGGVLYNDEVSRQDVKRLLDKNKDNELVKEWYSGEWMVMSECTILDPHPASTTGMSKEPTKRPRPDRVMVRGDEAVVVDFKFGKPRDEHKEQVRHYMELLKKMGYSQVSGYLWYVNKGEVIPTPAL